MSTYAGGGGGGGGGGGAARGGGRGRGAAVAKRRASAGVVTTASVREGSHLRVVLELERMGAAYFKVCCARAAVRIESVVACASPK